MRKIILFILLLLSSLIIRANAQTNKVAAQVLLDYCRQYDNIEFSNNPDIKTEVNEEKGFIRIYYQDKLIDIFRYYQGRSLTPTVKVGEVHNYLLVCVKNNIDNQILDNDKIILIESSGGETQNLYSPEPRIWGIKYNDSGLAFLSCDDESDTFNLVKVNFTNIHKCEIFTYKNSEFRAPFENE